MKLPLHIHWDYYGKHQVIDATGQIVLTLDNKHRKFVAAVVRKFNRDWRYVLFGSQPYEYTREDWLLEKNIR